MHKIISETKSSSNTRTRNIKWYFLNAAFVSLVKVYVSQAKRLITSRSRLEISSSDPQTIGFLETSSRFFSAVHLFRVLRERRMELDITCSCCSLLLWSFINVMLFWISSRLTFWTQKRRKKCAESFVRKRKRCSNVCEASFWQTSHLNLSKTSFTTPLNLNSKLKFSFQDQSQSNMKWIDKVEGCGNLSHLHSF